MEENNENISEPEIDFSDELNCLICVYNIFCYYVSENFNESEYQAVIFNKEKIESFTILEKRYIMLNILLKCVDNFSIDQELKEKARRMIGITAKFIREQFFIDEKNDIEFLLESFKFRLNNMKELEKHDTLDKYVKLIPDYALPDDYDPFQSEKLTNKSEIGNIVRTFHSSVSEYIKEPQFEFIAKTMDKDDYIKSIDL
jgi:hypothetical protein